MVVVGGWWGGGNVVVVVLIKMVRKGDYSVCLGGWWTVVGVAWENIVAMTVENMVGVVEVIKVELLAVFGYWSYFQDFAGWGRQDTVLGVQLLPGGVGVGGVARDQAPTMIWS